MDVFKKWNSNKYLSNILVYKTYASNWIGVGYDYILVILKNNIKKFGMFLIQSDKYLTLLKL